MSKSVNEIQTIIDLAVKKFNAPGRSARDLVACEALFIEALDGYVEIYGPKHNRCGFVHWYLGLIYNQMDDVFDRAEAHWEAAAERYSDNINLANIANNYADLLVKKGTAVLEKLSQGEKTVDVPTNQPVTPDSTNLRHFLDKTSRPNAENEKTIKRLRAEAEIKEEATTLFKRAADLRAKAFGYMQIAQREAVAATHAPAAKDTKKAATTVLAQSPAEIMAKLSKVVVGQKAAKRGLANAASLHIKRILMTPEERALTEKSNVLLLGPTGCGKTLLSTALAGALGVPFFATEATDLTAAGYVGGDVKSVIYGLLRACNGDAAAAQFGIVYIDEIDKIAAHNMGGQKDVGGRAVQEELLKILESTKIQVTWNGTALEIDTTNVLFICGGAFAGLGDVVAARKRASKSGIGFGADVQTKDADNSKYQKYAKAKDLVSLGMIAEFIGRLPRRVTINALTVNELERILIEPEKALTKQVRAMLGSVTDVRFTRGALRAMAEESHELGTHGRALREIMDQVLEPIVFAQPAFALITEEMVKNRAQEIEEQDQDDGPVKVAKDHDFIVDDDKAGEVVKQVMAALKAKQPVDPQAPGRALVAA